jgi:hypothetical protein
MDEGVSVFESAAQPSVAARPALCAAAERQIVGRTWAMSESEVIDSLRQLTMALVGA